MTPAHHAPALRAPDLATALRVLRAQGLRISASRRQVLAALFDPRPQTAEQLATPFPIVGICPKFQEDEGHAHP